MKYRHVDTYHEQEGRPVYCVTFNFLDPAHSKLFASCGGRRVTIYECSNTSGIKPLQGYKDEHAEEEFYVVKWSIDEKLGTPIVLAAGKLGQVWVLDSHKQASLWTAQGHGEAINDIAVQPEHPELFLTASKDWSIRLWNWRTRVCVAVISGEEGHTNEVLSLDFHPFDNLRFVSGGMDDTIKIWSLANAIKDINRSFAYREDQGRSFVAGHVTGPIFSSQKVHWNYVDCVRWYGDLLLSKSVDNRILMWKPLMEKEGQEHLLSPRGYGCKGHVCLIQEFHLENAGIWFVRFAMDAQCRLLACGNMSGHVFVFDLQAPSVLASRAKVKLKGNKEDKTVRQTAISRDGSIILACCDNSKIHRFDQERPAVQLESMQTSAVD